MGVYSGSALLGESVETMSPNGHVLDTLVESAQNEMNMFNAVINLDFMEAYNEAGMISISEADGDDAKENAQKNIGKKIKEFFKKVIAKIKQFVATFIAKIQNLVKNDAKLYKEYQKNFNANAEGYKLSKFRPLESPDKLKAKINQKMAAVGRVMEEANAKILKATSRDDIDNFVEKATTIVMKGGDKLKDRRDSAESRSSQIEALFFTSDKSEEDYKLTPTDVTNINAVMAAGGAKIVKQVKAIGDDAEKEIKAIQRDMKLDRPAVKASEDDLAMAKWNAQYKLAGKMGSYVSTYMSQVCNAAARYVAAARRAFVIAGKGATEKKVQESYGMDITTYDEILGEASDYYVEKALLA